MGLELGSLNPNFLQHLEEPRISLQVVVGYLGILLLVSFLSLITDKHLQIHRSDVCVGDRSLKRVNLLQIRLSRVPAGP